MIEARGLRRRFGDVVAVNDVSLEVPAGTILALLGPNGAGKTTIVRILTGVLAMSEGQASVAGYDVRRDPDAVRARIGLVTDVPGLHEQMNVTDYLDFFGSIYGLDRSERRHRIDRLLSFFELDAHQKERMVGFSKGMKQKVALARAVLHEPDALFLDEPTSGLDPLGARSVRELIVGMKRGNRSIVLCTHDLDEADRLADEIVILRRGRVVARGAPPRLRALGESDTTVRIALAAPCPGAAAALGTIDGVEASTELASGPVPGVAVEITYRTTSPTAVNPIVTQRLVAEGARVVSVTCATRSLEDAYAAAMASDEDRTDAND